jgi:hypothetical protein
VKRISKEVREEAAMICAIAASCRFTGAEAGDATGASELAMSLAYRSWFHSMHGSSHRFGSDWSQDWAEAEALLRTGWSPGDKP